MNMKTGLSFEEWGKLKGIQPNRLETNVDWHLFWKEVMRPHFLKKYWVNIAKHPFVLDKFCEAWKTVPFGAICSYMKEHHWYYGEENDTPTVEDLMENVLELASSCIDHENENENEWQSGGFCVSINKIDSNDCSCLISFKK